MRQQGLRTIDMRPSSSGDNTLANLVDRTTIAGRTARLLLEWLKPSSHISSAEPTCLAVTLTGEEIVEFVRESRQPDFSIVN